MRSLGQSVGELPKVPTLRQAIKARMNLPTRNWVSLIFTPNKYPVITFICEDKFRVNIREDEPLYRDVLDILSTIEHDDVTFFIDIPEGSEGRFEVLVDDETKTTWSSRDWGYKCETIPEKKKRARKEPRASTLEKA